VPQSLHRPFRCPCSHCALPSSPSSRPCTCCYKAIAPLAYRRLHCCAYAPAGACVCVLCAAVHTTATPQARATWTSCRRSYLNSCDPLRSPAVRSTPTHPLRSTGRPGCIECQLDMDPWRQPRKRTKSKSKIEVRFRSRGLYQSPVFGPKVQSPIRVGLRSPSPTQSPTRFWASKCKSKPSKVQFEMDFEVQPSPTTSPISARTSKSKSKSKSKFGAAWTSVWRRSQQSKQNTGCPRLLLPLVFGVCRYTLHHPMAHGPGSWQLWCSDLLVCRRVQRAARRARSAGC
jgi:hypothetical protein